MRLYKPVVLYVLIDIILLLIGFYVVLDWLPLTTRTPFEKYWLPATCYTFTWLICSYALRRYIPLHKQTYTMATLRLFYTVLFVFLIYGLILHLFFRTYSGYVLLTVSAGIFIVDSIYLSFLFAYKFAVQYNEFVYEQPEERVNAVSPPSLPLDSESYRQVCNTIRHHSGQKALDFLAASVDLSSANTRVYVRTDLDNLITNQAYRYSAIVQLERLNDMRNINRRFSVINEKLPDNGLFICCFEAKSTHKKEIMNQYPRVLNTIIYGFYFLFRRVMPKILFLRTIYHFLTRGKDRVFSKVEVLGRLYCMGYRVTSERKIGRLTYFVAERIKPPASFQKRIYGPLIRLRRIGKDKVFFDVYKMRTMHPYSEYLQSYIFERNSLKEGGKFYKDIRVTTLGHFMRKYWLDELPMLINLLKGEMKLVGVRPLSNHFFSLYSPELQTKRVKFKPGLLPPFYADMPKTLDEIQDSEMRYLEMCEQKGVLLTDVKYMFRIIINILFRKARSA